MGARFGVVAWRCKLCGHVEFFADEHLPPDADAAGVSRGYSMFVPMMLAMAGLLVLMLALIVVYVLVIAPGG